MSSVPLDMKKLSARGHLYPANYGTGKVVMAHIVVAHIVVAHTVMAHIVVAHTVVAHIVVAHIVVAQLYGHILATY